MKLYALIGYYDYDHQQCLGVFSSVESATKAGHDYGLADHEFDVDEFTLDKAPEPKPQVPFRVAPTYQGAPEFAAEVSSVIADVVFYGLVGPVEKPIGLDARYQKGNG